MAKKLWEMMQEDIDKNKQINRQREVNANNKFNTSIQQSGEFDTNKHTYSMNDLLKAYKNTSKENYNDFKNTNGITLWDTVLQKANDLGRVVENAWLGGMTGIKQSFNYVYKSGRNNLETKQKQEIGNVINSSKLSKTEKDFYMNLQKNNKKDEKVEKTDIIPISQKYNVNSLQDEEIDLEKIKRVSQTSGFDESIGKDNEKINENINKQSDGVTKKLAELAPSVGNMAVGGLVSSVNPGAGASYFALSSAGSYYDDAIQRGMTNEQAQNYAGIMGLMEGATEEVSFGNFSKAGKTTKALITGTGKEVTKEGIEQIGKAGIKKALKEYGIGIADNVMQEALIEPIQEVVAGSVGGEDKANWENIGQRMLQSGIDGGLVAVITGGAKIGIDSCVGIVEKVKRGKNVTQEELKIAVKEGSNEIDVEKSIIDSVQQQVNKYKDYNTGKRLDSVSQQWLNRANSIINGNNNSNLQQNTNNNQINPIIQQSTNQENTVVQNGNMEQVENKQTIKGYHGTEAEFENYSLEYFGKHDEGDFGKAVYFSKDRSTANKYGKNVKENNINLENPFVINNEQDYEKMWNELGKRANEEKLNIEEKKMIEDKYTSQTDKDYILYNTLTAEEKSNILQEMGYDGVIDNTYNQIAVFNPNNIENNSKTMYNNTESEGGINGEINRGTKTTNVERDIGESRIFEENKSQQYTEEEYRSWEQSIVGKTENELTYKEKAVKQKFKTHQNKDIIFIKTDNNKGYYAGASLENPSKVYIRTEEAEQFGLDRTAYHETMESNIRFADNEKQDIIMSTVQDMIEDPTFEKQKLEFWKEQEGNMPSDTAIAKDIICDRLAELNGETIDYKNVLSDEINNRINMSIEYFNKELGKTSSFDLQKNNIVNTNNIQEQTKASNLLDKVEENTQSLGYQRETGGKQRKHYKSVMESDQVGKIGKQSAKSLLENDTYKPISNIDTLATANENINKNGVENTYIAFKNKINSNERITLQDIATGERLIQIFSQGEDFEKVNGLIQDVGMLGTELGQNVQALSLIKRMSPEGQLMYLQKVVERTNTKENADLKVTDEMSKKILEAKGQEELENVMTDIAVELGEQLPVTNGDKVRSWRYLSMLGNPKTHIKNLGANVAMNITQQTKNKVAGAMEDVVGIFNKDIERTKTLRPANQDQRNFAKQDAEFMKDKIDGGGKYDIKNAIQSNKKQFNNKVLNAIANFNSDMLELEDNIFLKKAYQQAMQNYMSANKLSSSDMQNSNVLQKAREYSSYQAQEATFHQFSELAQRLTEIENKGGIAGKTLEAVIPFKKTPINIAKSGIEYSPIGLVKSLSYDLAQLSRKTKDYKKKLEKGFISEAEYKTGTSQLATKTIDNMAKGLTGTSLALLGYALKDMGTLKAGNDSEDDEFKEKLGNQEYAIKLGDNTYTLDWVSPSAIPMFMGATVHGLIHSEEQDNSNTLNSLMTSSAKALEPMTEMSMLQGLTSAISSYEQSGSNKLFDLGASAVSSYLGQFVPTVMGQVAKTIDDKERDTSSTEKGVAKKVDQFKKQQMAKIPIASKMLPVRKDVWGNEKTRDSNVLMRAYEVGLAPYNRKKVVEDYTEKELLNVFEDTGEKIVLPGIPNKDITIDKQKYRLTAEEYNKAKETFGKTSKSMLDSLVKKSEYKQLSDEQKANAIDNIYSYAKEKIKVDYAKHKKQEVETSASYNILNELKSSSNQSEYLSYSAKIQGVEKDTEKKKILANGRYSATTKEIIYKNTVGKDDNLYNDVLAMDNISINEYLNYNLQEFESDKEDDGTKQGKTINGSKKEKVQNYVNNMNITANQKLAIIGTKYKLKRKEQEELYNYLDKLLTQTEEKRLEIFSKYSKNFTIYEDNTMDFK